MKDFIDLPEDLLYLVALVFERDRRTLVALGKTCRALHRATRSVLFRHIGDLPMPRIEILERSLTADATLKAYVHSYPVFMEYGEILNDGLEKSLGFSNLRELAFVSSHKKRRRGNQGAMDYLRRQNLGRSEDQDFQCGFIDTYSFAGIQSLFLVGNFTTTEIMRFMLLPSVQTLRAKDIAVLREPHLSAHFAAQTSKLTSLSLVGDGLWSVEPETMHYICLSCPLLRDLQSQIPVLTSTELGWNPLRKSRVIKAVSPAALNGALAPLWARLRRLSLLQLRHNVPYDGTHMNFSGFEQLMDLEVTSCCLLPPGAPCEARNMLYGLLPARLRRLKLDFPRESGIFFHHLEGEPFLTQNPSVVPRSRYTWISELLRHKDTHFPGLARVYMQDPPGSIGYWYWKETQWVLPEEISTLVREVDVDLMVKISYPNPKSEMESWHERRCKPRFGTFPWS